MAAPLGALRWAAAVGFASLFVRRSLAKGSLSTSGGFAAFIVGVLTFASGLRFTAVLLTFFVTCSYFTKKGKERKRRVEEDYEISSCRNWQQVLCNGLGATAVCGLLVYLEWRGVVLSPSERDALSAAFLAHYACCTADTWASELGVLARTTPVHILTWRPVPAGTNGGVTAVGLSASVAGGAAMGLSHWVVGLLAAHVSDDPSSVWRILIPTGLANAGPWMGSWVSIPIMAALGLFGSVLDSVLGAVLQYSGSVPGTERVVNGPRPGSKFICGRDLVSNNTVNLLSSIATTIVGAALAYHLP
jgi:uncharacterized protein (TIGR00297 family)